MAATDILAALQGPLETGADTPAGIGASSVANSIPSLIDPYGSAGSNAAYVFGGSILAALLGNMAKSDAAEYNSNIATKQSNFLSADPAERLAMTQQDPNTFAKLQAAISSNDLLQQAQDTATKRQLEIQQQIKDKNVPDLLDVFKVPNDLRDKIHSKDDLDSYIAQENFKQKQDELALQHESMDAARQTAIDDRKDRVAALDANRISNQLLATGHPYAQAQTVAPLLEAAETLNARQKENPDPQTDLALVDTYNKIMNPGGILRAQLVEQTINAQNPGNKVAGELDKVMGGGMFNQAARDELMNVIRFAGQEKLLAGKNFADNQLAIAKTRGVDPDAVIAPDYYKGLFGRLENSGASPVPPAAPPGYVLTGKVDADGNYGIRKAQ
jgi:hypothetical protein